MVFGHCTSQIALNAEMAVDNAPRDHATTFVVRLDDVLKNLTPVVLIERDLEFAPVED